MAEAEVAVSVMDAIAESHHSASSLAVPGSFEAARVGPGNFELMRVIGQGGYGKVSFERISR